MFPTRRIFHSRITLVSLSRLSSSVHAPIVQKGRTKELYNGEFDSSLMFNNAQTVFGHRSTSELLRAFVVLHACAIEPLVTRSYKLMRLGERILGQFLMGKLMSPFYYQFVAGDSEKQMKQVVDVLSTVGINVMIAGMVETDIGESDGGKSLFETNFQKTLDNIDITSRLRPKSEKLRPVCQTKITAHISAESLTTISKAYVGLTPTERSTWVRAIAERINRLLHFEHTSERTPVTFPVSDVPEQDLKALDDCLPRLVKIGEECRNKKVILAVDAEYTYTNPAISLLTLALMSIFNNGLPVIWYTYQGYLKNTKTWLEHDYDMIRSFGVSFAAKIVRGAYMEKERETAASTNQPDPVNDTYELTNKNYNSLIDFLLERVAREPGQCQLMAATHNEESVHKAVQSMQRLEIPNSSEAFVFAQIYGMAENISVPLSKAGYNVYKSIPYGSFSETLPYLSRRANENKAVFRGARRERELLSQELQRRLAKRN